MGQIIKKGQQCEAIAQYLWQFAQFIGLDRTSENNRIPVPSNAPDQPANPEKPRGKAQILFNVPDALEQQEKFKADFKNCDEQLQKTPEEK
ncbi:MAG: hypothetical protein LBH37_00490 [Oscillospiraceae bacterium]|jgi:hypothetical protein|nr:hypothetical protein [Oscillospiraceae bacterium]